MSKRIILILFLLSFLTTRTLAGDTLFLDASQPRISLNDHLQMLYDDEGTIDLNGVISKSDDFAKVNMKEVELNFPTSIWLKIELFSYPRTENLRIVCNVSGENDLIDAPIEQMEVFFLDSTNSLLGQSITGGLVSKSRMDHFFGRFIAAVEFTFESNQNYTVFIKLSTKFESRTIPLDFQIRKPTAGLPKVAIRNLIPTIGAWGMFFIIGLFVMVFFLMSKERVYLYFSLACLTYSIDMLGLYPPGLLQTCFPNFPELNIIIWHLHFFSIPLILLFGLDYAEIKTKIPKWYPIYIGLLICLFSVLAYYLISNLNPPFSSNHNLLFYCFILILPVCLRLMLLQDLHAFLFGLGFLLFFLGNMLGVILLKLDISWYVWVITSGQLGLLFIYAIGLGLKLLESQRNQVETEKLRSLQVLRSKFYTNVSHEFRTPLSIIIAPLQRALDEELEGKQEVEFVRVQITDLSMILRNANRLKGLIEQITNLNKLEAGKLQLQYQKLLVLPFLKERIGDFAILAAQKGIHFQTKFATAGQEVEFDPDVLEKIVANILSNAVKFCSIGDHIIIDVKANARKLDISVKDSGLGISEKHLDHIFERYFQGDYNQQSGMGIGMALVSELITLHGGTIVVESEVNEGTEVKFSIKFGEEREKTFSKALPNGIKFPSNESNLLKQSNMGENHQYKSRAKEDKADILIIEDNPDLLNTLMSILKEKYTVHGAARGEDGLKIAEEIIPNLIISDLVLPGLSGIQVCRAVKSKEMTSHIPFILLTAKTDRVSKIEGLDSGADDYLGKPFDTKELSLKVKNFLKMQTEWQRKYQQALHKDLQLPLQSIDQQFINKINDIIKAHLSNEAFSVEDLAKQVGYSRSQLFRKLKAITGMSPLQFVRTQRLAVGYEILNNNALTVSETAYKVGFSDPSYFSKCFKKKYGFLPNKLSMKRE